MNFILELRETARHCPKRATARSLRTAADVLAAALKNLADDPTPDAMIAANGAWSHAVAVLKAAPPLGGDGTAGGALPVPKYERMAA